MGLVRAIGGLGGLAFGLGLLHQFDDRPCERDGDQYQAQPADGADDEQLRIDSP